VARFVIDPDTGQPLVTWAAPRKGNINHAWVSRPCGEKVPLCDRAGEWGSGEPGWKPKPCGICERKVREGEWPWLNID